MKKLVILIFLYIAACQTNSSVDTLFLETGEDANISFENTLEEDEQNNIIEYLNYYNGGGVAVADFNKDGFEDIYFVKNRGENELYWNKGNWKFSEGAKMAGVQGKSDFQNGVSVVDINADGFPDIHVCGVDYKNWVSANEFYLNNGDGTFDEVSTELGLDFKGYSQQAMFFDVDNDGDLDLYLLKHSVHPAGKFHKAHQRYSIDSLAGDIFLINNGDKEHPNFVDKTKEYNVLNSQIGYGLAIAAADFNSDGYTDLYISNDFNENDYLYLNNKGRNFYLSSKESFRVNSEFSMGSDVGDINGDGYPDLFTTDMKPWVEIERKNAVGSDPFHIHKYKRNQGYLEQFPKNNLHLSRGVIQSDSLNIPVFEESASYFNVESSDWSWGVLIEDFDGNGLEDIFITNGIKRRANDLDYIQFLGQASGNAKTAYDIYSKMPPGQINNRLFSMHNNGGAIEMKEKSSEWGLDYFGTSNGSAVGDFDNDGRIDIVVNNLNSPAHLYRNVNAKPQTTVDVGARRVAFQIKGSGIQRNIGTRSWLSHSTNRIFAGGAQEITIQWSKDKVELFQLKPNQVNFLLPGQGTPSKLHLFTPQSSNSLIDTLSFNHKEDLYTSFVQTPLLIEGTDEMGPTGLLFKDKLFIGSSYLQAPMFVDTTHWDTSWIYADRYYEDTDSKLLTLGNGDEALIVVSGSSNGDKNSSSALDRVYFNHNEPSRVLSSSGTHASCVEVLDINNDGIEDIFIGERVVWNDYGASPKHALYFGTKDGWFEKQSYNWLSKLGMVTAAASGDVTGDGRKDLIVATDWGAVQLVDFSNDTPTITPLTENGWWRSITLVDLDEDGDLDVLAGGMGKNHGITVGKKTPIELFIKDFDRNGNRDFIYSYYNDGTRYPLFGRDELIKESVQFRKQYLKNRTFSGKPFDELFTPQTLEGAQHLSVEFTGSAVLWNQGGSWDMEPLPAPFQLGPIYASLKTPQGLWLAGGSDAMNTIIGTQESFCGGVLQGAPGALEYQPCKYIFRGSVKSFVPLKEKAAVLLNDGPALLIQP